MTPSLRHAPLSMRVFASTVLATLGIGYLMALVYLYAQEVRPHRLEGHGLVQGVANTYHGIPGESPLLVSLRGSMSATASEEEILEIRAWIEAGAPETGFDETIGPIISESCAACHDAEGTYFPPLTTYEEVSTWAQPGGGISVQRLARQTHVHLFGIPMLLFIISWLFVQTRYPEKLKSVLVVVPFLGVVWDVAHWWITKLNPDAAAGVILGGILLNLGFAAQWLMTAWDIWAPRRGGPDGP